MGATRAAIMLVVLLRGGLLALVVTLYFLYSAVEVPLTLDLGAWFAAPGFPVVGALLGLSVYGFYVSLGGKPVLGRALLGD